MATEGECELVFLRIVWARGLLHIMKLGFVAFGNSARLYEDSQVSVISAPQMHCECVVLKKNNIVVSGIPRSCHTCIIVPRGALVSVCVGYPCNEVRHRLLYRKHKIPQTIIS